MSSIPTHQDDVFPKYPYEDDSDISGHDQQQDHTRSRQPSQSSTEGAIRRRHPKFIQVTSMSHRERLSGPKEETRSKGFSHEKPNKSIGTSSSQREQIPNQSQKFPGIVFEFLKSLWLLVCDASLDALKLMRPLIRFTLSMVFRGLIIYLFFISIKSNYVSSLVVRQVTPICSWPVVSMVPICRNVNSDIVPPSTEPTSSHSIFNGVEAIQPHVLDLTKEMGWATHISFELAVSERAVNALIGSVRVFPVNTSHRSIYSFPSPNTLCYSPPSEHLQVESSNLQYKHRFGMSLQKLSASLEGASTHFVNLESTLSRVFYSMSLLNEPLLRIMGAIKDEATRNEEKAAHPFIFAINSIIFPSVTASDVIKRGFKAFSGALGELEEELEGLNTLTETIQVTLETSGQYLNQIKQTAYLEDAELAAESSRILESLWIRTVSRERAALSKLIPRQKKLSELDNFHKQAVQNVDRIRTTLQHLFQATKSLGSNAGKAGERVISFNNGNGDIEAVTRSLQTLTHFIDKFQTAVWVGERNVGRVMQRYSNRPPELLLGS
ncbi:hypothetical protein CPB86DRAFT_812671 [Serendipita vermifera]|nr:hypothetical protein CPB86DRAFT_812671 [Serendipita vermifera]